MTERPFYEVLKPLRIQFLNHGIRQIVTDLLDEAAQFDFKFPAQLPETLLDFGII